jgi:DNA-binding response OmpR family regulator
MGEVAIAYLAAEEPNVFAFYSPVKLNLRFFFACTPEQPQLTKPCTSAADRAEITGNILRTPGEAAVSEVGILVVDNDVVSQQALKHVLDAEGWSVRIVPTASHALPELASGTWNLAIVNTALMDLNGPVFAMLRDLAQAGAQADLEAAGVLQRRCRVLFLVPVSEAKKAQPILEREGLPYSFKPYHLHDFLEKVSELLVESGALEESLRGIGDFSSLKTRKRARGAARASRRGTMFASREDYQMTEEEMAEFERQEEEERKKREKDLKDRGYHY